MIMKVTSDEKEQLSAAIDRMNEGLDVFIQFYNESEKDEPLIQLEDDTAKLMKEARELYGQDKLNETLNAIIKQILSISLSEEGRKMKSNRIFISWLRWPLYIRIGLIILVLILLFGQTIYLLEPKQFTSVFEGIWWAVITVSTVGYGDYVPQTPLGQIVGMLLVLSGASFVTAYFATLASAAFSKQHRYVEGKVKFKGRDHVIIIGWNEKSNHLLRELQLAAPSKTVVLIDDSLKEGPLIENVHFIRGHAADDDTLKKRISPLLTPSWSLLISIKTKRKPICFQC